MHRTDSLDYWVIVDGEITLATDTDEIHLKPGDTLVIRGANHSWVKASDKPYLAVTVSVNAKPLPD
jgi:mannose-6-phosphate isomerase-like protein (cupin superfamily)